MDFDLEIAQHGIPCFLADASVETLSQEHELFKFEKMFLRGENRENFMTLNGWVIRNAPEEGDLLLQMDIEGAEYETIEACDDDVLKRFRQIVLEVHDFEQVFTKEGLERFTAVFVRLKEHFEIVHLHNNNSLPLLNVAGLEFPSVLELSLLRKDRVKESSDKVSIPHALETPNVHKLPDVVIPEFWQ